MTTSSWRPTPRDTRGDPVGANRWVEAFLRFDRAWQAHRLKFLVAVAASIAVAGALAVHALFLQTTSVTLTVDGRVWQRDVAVEHFVTVSEEGSFPPRDARNVTPYQAISHYRRVPSGTRQVPYSCGTTDAPRTCHRTETVYREEPVYETRYRYDVDRWRHARWQTASGDQDSNPAWPATEHLRNVADRPAVGTEREGRRRRESYKVRLTRPDYPTVYFQEVEQATWERQPPGRRVTGHVNARNHLRSVDW